LDPGFHIPFDKGTLSFSAEDGWFSMSGNRPS